MELVLATLNAKFQHASFGLRSLRANLAELRERSVIREFTIQDRPIDIAEALLAEKPRVIGLGVYIWNAQQSLQLVRLLKQLAPEVVVALGGPEVSYEWEDQPIVALADHLITGEGELAFLALCRAVLSGGRADAKVLPGGLPDLKSLALPYDEYTDDDLRHRVVYVEASRGCPFKCEFCLSSLDTKVRAFPLDRLLAALERLIGRGARQLKFVDRTFNLSPIVSHAILDFLLARQHLGLFSHFEMIPDRLTPGLRERLARFPKGAVQLELGIQTFDDATSERISRPQDAKAIEENLRWLHASTGAHVHADLIVGLPGEDVATFARGFDRLVALGPHEIQVGILKRLRGTPIERHDAAEQVAWSREPPYEILRNRHIDFETMQRLKRFARAWDLVVNRGNFATSAPLVWRDRSPFEGFLELTDWLAARVSFGGVALHRLTELLLRFLVDVRGLDRFEAGAALARDYAHAGRGLPPTLQPFEAPALRPVHGPRLPARQQRHHAR